jgi:ABC-type transport system involved in multi-copper enzyme maturation permease subunit
MSSGTVGSGNPPDSPEAGTPAEANSVMMGRQDYLSVLLRLTGMELYKLRNRAMSVVLGTIGVLAIVMAFLLITLLAVIFLGSAATQQEVSSISQLLRLPFSLYVAIQVLFTLGQVLIVILVGAMVGGEYGVGTIRLLFTRGPARWQFLVAKMLAAISCIAIGVVAITLVGILAGQLLNFVTGITPTFDFFSAAWLGYALLYLLSTMFCLFVYAMMALFIATLGRSTAAGIAGALVWIFVAEPLVKVVCIVSAAVSKGITADIARSIPDYLLSTNMAALLANQNESLFGASTASSLASSSSYSLSNLHALLVLVGYLILFTGLAWLINEYRDITN